MSDVSLAQNRIEIELSPEERLFLEVDSPEMPPSDIVAFTELRSVSDLVRMHSEGQLIIDPDFQREVVWRPYAQTRFIDSLMKQLPIPSMCLSLDYKTQTWQVIDGLQRISSMIRFLDRKSEWRLSRLPDIDPMITGKRISDFWGEDKELIRRRRIVENTTIPVNVLRCDYSNQRHRDYIFEIFHRLNTGGQKLTNQEIRNCIYSGLFNQLLNDLNGNEAWLRISRLETATGHRYKGQEIILRFFAFSDGYHNYNGQLAKFLNEYMGAKQLLSPDEANSKRDLFEKTVDLIDASVGRDAHRKSLALFEAFMVGIALNLESVSGMTPARIAEKFDELDSLPEFSQESLGEGLASRDKLVGRLDAAVSVFEHD